MPYKSSVGSIAAAALSVTSGIATQAQDLSKYPDWSGQWKRAIDPRLPSLANGIQVSRLAPPHQAPLTPEYQARFEARAG